MLTFTAQQIFASVYHAAIYGCLFAILLSGFMLIKGVIKGGRQGITNIIKFDKIFPLPRFNEIKASSELGAILSALFIFFFALGFILLSYYSLDGEIRLYMLIIAFASFYLSKFAFSGIFEKLFLNVFRIIFIAITFILRVIIIPLKALFGFFRKTANSKFAKVKK